MLKGTNLGEERLKILVQNVSVGAYSDLKMWLFFFLLLEFFGFLQSGKQTSWPMGTPDVHTPPPPQTGHWPSLYVQGGSGELICSFFVCYLSAILTFCLGIRGNWVLLSLIQIWKFCGSIWALASVPPPLHPQPPMTWCFWNALGTLGTYLVILFFFLSQWRGCGGTHPG